MTELVKQAIRLSYTALLDNNEFNLNRGRSYMKAAGLCGGIAANLGRSDAQLVLPQFAIHSGTTSVGPRCHPWAKNLGSGCF